MRYFLIYVILMIAIALTLGCGTENPVCTSSFCVIPRDAVDGEVIEIDEDKALAFIQTLAVDTPEATPVETPENSEVSLMDIITDAARAVRHTSGKRSHWKQQSCGGQRIEKRLSFIRLMILKQRSRKGRIFYIFIRQPSAFESIRYRDCLRVHRDNLRGSSPR